MLITEMCNCLSLLNLTAAKFGGILVRVQEVMDFIFIQDTELGLFDSPSGYSECGPHLVDYIAV